MRLTQPASFLVSQLPSDGIESPGTPRWRGPPCCSGCLWEGEKDCDKTDFSQAALRPPRVKFGKPLASPGIALGPRPLLLPSFSVPRSGRAPVARPSPGLTPRLSAQPVGHLGLELLVGANSGAWPSPVALMGFHHPPAPLGWVPGRAQCCPGLSAATKERHPSLNRAGPGGEVWGPRVHPASESSLHQSHLPSPNFPKRQRQDKGQRINTE